MGTNFYTLAGTHIGKRSAAGMYCWDCMKTLCIQGEAGIHLSESEWLPACPSCRSKPVKELIEHSAAGRELGFNKSIPAQKSGVKTCSSFRWAVEPVSIKKIRFIKDEYGQRFTTQQFWNEILAECPVRYFSIGKYFF